MVAMSDDTKQREQMTPKAAASFVEYYSMGSGRSLRRLAEQSGVNVGLLERWSARYDWQDRIVELEERELDDLARTAARKRSRVYMRTLGEYERRTVDEAIVALALNDLNSIYDRMRPAEVNAVPAPAAAGVTIVMQEREDGPQ